MVNIPAFEDLVVTIDGVVATIRLNRPKSLNSFRLETYGELAKALNVINSIPEITITVITGTGKFFSSGMDLAAAAARKIIADPVEHKEARWKELTGGGVALIFALIEHTKVTVVALNGGAIGYPGAWIGGADIIVASDKAYLYLPFMKLGLSAETGVTHTWTARANEGFAADFLYTNKRMTVKELGLKGIQRVWPDAEFDAKLKEMIDDMKTGNARSMLEAKKLMKDPSRIAYRNSVMLETLYMVNRPAGASNTAFAQRAAEIASKKTAKL
ncbi:hypothetical protein SmJEL517_g02666 [Synchytrium microbalum]|uniref:Enoyl-CoA hydratase n=1 Tax=Synchytrium microbalum TaxID=1806994 RepID=A0A507C6A6_9FUNG|nr:uncharacterized protein SmJEL517_g02666 [Synchytrium microbalum]TPX34639.1 hypothetical protein SmJEL517_g02666 [Synchytrium microbalum]